MTDTLIAIFQENTALRKDVDFFYLDIPLDKSGLWFSDRQVDNAPTKYREYDIYYRAKSKSSAKANVDYITSKIDNLDACRLANGTVFTLKILYTWDYLDKDTEGYYVFANTVRLYA